MPNRQLQLHPLAAADYDAAFEWYLEHSPDAARRFDTESARAVEQILRAPQRWATGHYGTRRYLLKQFPFLVIYRELSESVIQIVAFAHTSRKPGYWESRVKH